MMPGSEERWRDGSGPTAGALGHLLERMTNDFTPQHDSQHFQPGFIPSASPPWTTTGQAPLTSLGSQMTPLQPPHTSLGSQMPPQLQPTHANLGSQVSSLQPPHGNMAPQMTPLQPPPPPPTTSTPGTIPLSAQMGGPGPRSYSVSQDPFSDMGGSRSPLLRSSSDLGLRLNNFTDGRMDGFMDSSRDSIDSMSAFFPEVQRGACVSSGTPPPPIAGDPQGLTPSPDFSFYTNEHERLMDGVSVNNITAKLSNFTATLGSLFSPFDPFRSNLPVGDAKSPSVSQSSSVNAALEASLGTETTMASQCNSSKGGVPLAGNQPNRASKPSYSDVLSKNTVQDGRLNATSAGLNSRSSSSNSNSSNGNIAHPPQSPSPGPTASRPEHQNRNQSSKSKSKARNLGNASSGNNNNGSHNNKSNDKSETPVSSRVGLDDFCLTEVGLSNGRISAYEHYDWGEKTDGSAGYGTPVSKTSANSPTHQGKKHSGKDTKKVTPEKIGSSVLADENGRGNDQLNNKISSSSQQKQAPRLAKYFLLLLIYLCACLIGYICVCLSCLNLVIQ